MNARHSPQTQHSKTKGKITGTLIDAEGPIEYATMVLLRQNDLKEIDGSFTDNKGQFKLTELALGSYQVHFSFLGFENVKKEEEILSAKNPSVDLDDILMESSSINLDEVLVVSEKALVENNWDKRATLGITIGQPFSENLSFPTELSGENFYQRSEYIVPFHSFGITFGYRFGKLDFIDKQRSSKVCNTDLKQGE